MSAGTPVAYISALQQRFADIQGPDIRDICYATQNRQFAVRDLSKLVEWRGLPIVPTRTAYAKSAPKPGARVMSLWLKDARTVGITAGGSAPEALVDDVIEALRRIGPMKVPVPPGREENIEFRLPAELAAG
jgi:4-hydroxy-3-methylbut-2-enyl diphosphate reductase